MPAVGRIRREPRRGNGDENRSREEPQAGPLHAHLPFPHTWIRRGEEQVANHAANGQKKAAHRRASSHEIDVARAQRLIHESAKPRPRGHELHDKRTREQRTNREAVHAADRAQ